MTRRLPVCAVILLLLYSKPVYAAHDLIDIPTPGTINRYSMEFNFRLYYNGGVVSRLSFGVSNRLNIGCSLDIDSLIGITSPAIRQPALNLKFRLFDGAGNLPALAFGYDGQGYRYDAAAGAYLHKEKGIYLCGDMEVFTENLEFTFGASLAPDGQTDMQLFGGTMYTLLKNELRLLSFMAECDNIFYSNRYNAGIRIYPGPNINIDLGIIDLITTESVNNPERLVKINYRGQF